MKEKIRAISINWMQKVRFLRTAYQPEGYLPAIRGIPEKGEKSASALLKDLNRHR
jgi:hypothetical protein